MLMDACTLLLHPTLLFKSFIFKGAGIPEWNSDNDQTNKQKSLLQIYEITLLKGVGDQSVDLSNFRSECNL